MTQTATPARPIITIWHNNVGRPVPCPGLPDGYEGRSGVSGMLDVPAEWTAQVERYGAAITTIGNRPSNHHVIGIGGGHNDADWAESRFAEGSQCAWSENQPTDRYFHRIEGIYQIERATR